MPSRFQIVLAVVSLSFCGALSIGGRLTAQDDDAKWAFVSNDYGSNDTGNGTRENPYADINWALSKKPDVKVLPSKPGTPYGVVGLTNSMPNLQYNIVGEEGPMVTKLVGLYTEGNKKVQLLGFTVINTDGHGVSLRGGDLARVINCVIAFCRYDGIYSDGNARILAYNTVIYGCNNAMSAGNSTDGQSQGAINCIFTRNRGWAVAGYFTGAFAWYSYLEHNDAGRIQGLAGASQVAPLTEGLGADGAGGFVNAQECDFRLAKDELGKSLFHQGDPGIKNPDGTRSDPGAFGGPDATGWFRRGTGTRPVVSSLTTIPTPELDGKLKVKVRVKVTK